jgi:hypothetical protein
MNMVEGQIPESWDRQEAIRFMEKFIMEKCSNKLLSHKIRITRIVLTKHFGKIDIWCDFEFWPWDKNNWD